jgi:hypothetical protein
MNVVRLDNQPMFWLDGLVLASGAAGLVPRLAEFKLQRPAHGGQLMVGRGFRGEGGFDRAEHADAQDFTLDRLVDPEAAEGDAAAGAMFDRRPAAAVPRHVPLGARVRDMESPATVAAAKETR